LLEVSSWNTLNSTGITVSPAEVGASPTSSAQPTSSVSTTSPSGETSIPIMIPVAVAVVVIVVVAVVVASLYVSKGARKQKESTIKDTM
jgi:hypothetical protein